MIMAVDTLFISEAWYVLLLWGIVCGLLTGFVAGAMAGFSGLGGGLIYVPAFFILMPDDDASLSLQVFASLVAVTITGFFSARAHWRLNHVRLDFLARLLPALAIGCALGLWLTLRIPEVWLLLALALLNLIVAWDYWHNKSSRKKQTVSGLLTPLAFPIGYISGSLGIGGGTMLVPLLRRQLPLREAIGTSAACGMMMAALAVSLNLLGESAWHQQIGQHIELLAGIWIGLFFTVPKASAWAAGCHSHLDESLIRHVLTAVFLMLAAGMLIAAYINSGLFA